jgi:hypothetical protein
MANLVRLTTTKITRLCNIGSYSFNAFKVKKISPLGTGSLIYYHDGTPGVASIVKIEVSESPTTVKAALTGALDMQIELSVVEINGKNHILTENIKTSDIVIGFVDPKDSGYSYLVMGNAIEKYRVHNALADIETAANNYSFSGGSVVSIDYTTNIPFDNPLTIIASHSLTSNEIFSIKTTGAKNGNSARLLIINNSFTPDLANFKTIGTSDNSLAFTMLNFLAEESGSGLIYICNVSNFD